MPGFEIVQERVTSYDEHGHRTDSERYYIKMDESAEALLGELRGARLSFFYCVSLHEVAVRRRHARPYTISDVANVTNFSERALVYAAPFLLEHDFLVVSGTTGKGEKMYRPSGTYAWFGDDRGAIFAPRLPGLQKPVDPGAMIDDRGAKTDARGRKKTRRGVQKRAHHDDDVIQHELHSENENIIIHDRDAARELFAAAGFQGPWLEDVARVAAPLDRARVWAEWTARAKAVPDRYPHPYGYVHKVYCADPDAVPPAIAESTPAEQPPLSRYDPQYAKFIHGTSEHAEYCRQHPDAFDCDCGNSI